MTKTHHRLPTWMLFAIAIAFGLIAASPLWGAGLVNTRGGGDSPFLIQRTMDMAENLRYGQFPPRWMGHAAYDLGYPLFNHYAALPYYISGGLHALGMDIILAIQVTQTLGFILAAVAMTLWARKITHSDAAILAMSAAYTFAPFHLVNVYVRGDSLSEFYAFVWYPLILWSLYRVAKHPSVRPVVTAGVCYGALVLTHNISAMTFSPFALAYALWLIWQQEARRKRWQAYALIIIPFVLGFLFSAWFWLPALGETSAVHMGDEFTEGYFHYSNHFRTWNLVQSSLRFDYSVATTVEAAGPFSMGLGQAILTLAGLIYAIILLIKRRGTSDQRRNLAFLIGGLLLATVMITPLSKPLWDYLPLLGLSQFPWRFLSIQALFTAALTGVLLAPFDVKDNERPVEQISPSPTREERRKAVYDEAVNPSQNSLWLRISGLVAIIGVILLSALWQLKPERLLVDQDGTTWETLTLYETFTGNIGTTIRYEYLPELVNPRPYISDTVIDGEGHPITQNDTLITAQQLVRKPNKQQWALTLEAGDTVSFPLYAWLGWHAQLDGHDIVPSVHPGTGRLTLDIPVGQHDVVFYLRNTSQQTLSIAISLAIIVISSVASVTDKTHHSAYMNAILLLLVVLVVSLAFPALNRGVRATSAPFFDFDSIPYPHAGPVIFPHATLHDVQLSTEHIAPGESLDVNLAWSVAEDETVTMRISLVSPAEARHGVDYTLTSVEVPVSPVQTVHLDIPEDISRGVYLVKVQVFDNSGERFGRTVNGTGMGTLYAGVVRIPQGSSASELPVLVEFPEMTLHHFDAQQPTDTELDLNLGWSTPGTLSNWTLSFRLLNVHGEQLVNEEGGAIQLDIEPGYGYLPTTSWTPGELVTDHIILPLPEGLAPGDYVLRLISYQRNGGITGGEVDIPIQLTQPTLYDLRESCCEQMRKGKTILCQQSGIALLDLTTPTTVNEGEDLVIYAQWNAVAPPEAEVLAEWSVLNAKGDVITNTSGPLAVGSQSQTWPYHTWVRTPVSFDLPALLDGGVYSLSVKLISEGDDVACDLPYTVEVIPRYREFTVSNLKHTQSAVFGESIRLLGYEVEQNRKDSTLELSLWWQAMDTPTLDYKRFVHVYNRGTEQIVMQDDAMPRNWTYPTTWWQTGEVVSETITLDISEVPSGSYVIGVGWYDPTTVTRLVVTESNASIADRVTLDAFVNIK